VFHYGVHSNILSQSGVYAPFRLQFHPVRRLRTILTIISLILFLIVVGDRVSHFWRGNQVIVEILRDEGAKTGYVGLELTTAGGEVVISSIMRRRETDSFALQPDMHCFAHSYPRGSPPVDLDGHATWLGFHCGFATVAFYDGPTTFDHVMAPSWFLAALFTILPARWAWRRHRDRDRLRKGHCSNCGYDLRASKERCPECGNAIGEGDSKFPAAKVSPAAPQD
jgi:hypothetical protein